MYHAGDVRLPECNLDCESTEGLGASNPLNKHSLPRIKYVDQRLILEYFLNPVIPELSIARSDRLPFEKYYEHSLLLATLFLFHLPSHSKNVILLNCGLILGWMTVSLQVKGLNTLMKESSVK